MKVLGVCIGPDLYEDRNWEEIMSKVSNLTQKWAERKLSLKGRMDMENSDRFDDRHIPT